jgi:type IV pilus assembly protein PilW
MGAAWMLYRAQSQTTISQEQVTNMQQNLRVAVFQLKHDLRLAGFDPTGSGNFGITSVGLDGDGNSTIQLTADLNGNGLQENSEIFSYDIFDLPATGGGDGFPDFTRRVGTVAPGRQLTAENIQAMGLAYAFDDDNDGLLDTDGAGNVIWAIDADNGGDLDTNLDTNSDGVIDCRDGPSAPLDCSGKPNENIAGVALATDVPLSRIRAVRIWLLARGRHPDESYFDNNTYVVGRQIISPQDNLRRRLFETVVQCRNMGLN